MSFREKIAWISLLTISVIYAIYFWSVFHSRHPGDFHFGGILQTVIVLAVAQAVLTFAITLFALKDAKVPRDEREKLIDLRSTQFAYGALAGSIACVCFFGGFNPPIIFNINTLLLILVIAELLRLSCQIVQYRRGA